MPVDWPIASPGWDVQEAWVQVASSLTWGVILWAGCAAIFALLLLPIVGLAVRSRRFWCPRAQREVEVEFEARGLIGFRRAVAVRSCSLFDPPTDVRCERSCLDREVRERVPTTPPRPWRRP